MRVTRRYYGIFLERHKVDELIETMRKEKESILEFEFIEDSKHYCASIFPDSLTDISVLDFINKVYEKASKIETVAELLKEKGSLEKRIKKLIKILHRRTREPHTFLETVITAFTDIFKV